MRFPLIQEKLVKTRVYSFVSSAMNNFAAGPLEEDPLINVAIETSHCKLFGTTRAWDTLYDALQVAGGAGYLATQPYEKRMRDFRVATLFEGTTEIHSIYPPLFLMRKTVKQIQQMVKTKFSQIWSLVKFFFKKTQWPLAPKKRVMRKASKLARANARTIRKMIVIGLLFHGKNIVHKEFFLRRITILSLYLFGLLAVLSKLTADELSGSLDPKELHLLQYFLEEATEVRKVNKSIFNTGRDTLNTVIFRELIPSLENNGKVQK
jgi:acyl-CoA dehydrogenase family protein 9